MSTVPELVDELTDTCYRLRGVIRSSKDDAEKEKVVLKHLRETASQHGDLRVNDWQKGNYFSISLKKFFLLTCF